MRLLLFILISIVALTAVPSGLLLVAEPDGTTLGMTTELLQYTPFSNYLLPGLFLAVVVGGSGLLALFLLLDNHPHAYHYTIFCGLVLVTWMLLQMMSVGYYNMLQGLFFAIGILISLLSYQLMGKVAA
ncbi:MAG: hypothetical protein ACM3VS_16660 [Candidatus Dadabacteria bacterium]